MVPDVRSLGQNDAVLVICSRRRPLVEAYSVRGSHDGQLNQNDIIQAWCSSTTEFARAEGLGHCWAWSEMLEPDSPIVT